MRPKPVTGAGDVHLFVIVCPHCGYSFDVFVDPNKVHGVMVVKCGRSTCFGSIQVELEGK